MEMTKTNGARGLVAMVKNLKWWQVGLIAVGVSFLGGLSSISAGEEQKLYAQELKQAPWAPPGWLFAPAWTLNNFFLLLALQRILLDENSSKRKKLLAMQIAIWVIFFSFGYIYFQKKSTILAAVWTVSDAVLSLCSILLLNKTDRKTALLYAPLTVWTTFASSIAIYQALYNPDEALQIAQPLP